MGAGMKIERERPGMLHSAGAVDLGRFLVNGSNFRKWLRDCV